MRWEEIEKALPDYHNYRLIPRGAVCHIYAGNVLVATAEQDLYTYRGVEMSFREMITMLCVNRAAPKTKMELAMAELKKISRSYNWQKAQNGYRQSFNDIKYLYFGDKRISGMYGNDDYLRSYPFNDTSVDRFVKIAIAETKYLGVDLFASFTTRYALPSFPQSDVPFRITMLCNGSFWLEYKNLDRYTYFIALRFDGVVYQISMGGYGYDRVLTRIEDKYYTYDEFCARLDAERARCDLRVLRILPHPIRKAIEQHVSGIWPDKMPVIVPEMLHCGRGYGAGYYFKEDSIIVAARDKVFGTIWSDCAVVDGKRVSCDVFWQLLREHTR